MTFFSPQTFVILLICLKTGGNTILSQGIRRRIDDHDYSDYPIDPHFLAMSTERSQTHPSNLSDVNLQQRPNVNQRLLSGLQNEATTAKSEMMRISSVILNMNTTQKLPSKSLSDLPIGDDLPWDMPARINSEFNKSERKSKNYEIFRQIAPEFQNNSEDKTTKKPKTVLGRVTERLSTVPHHKSAKNSSKSKENNRQVYLEFGTRTHNTTTEKNTGISSTEARLNKPRLGFYTSLELTETNEALDHSGDVSDTPSQRIKSEDSLDQSGNRLHTQSRLLKLEQDMNQIIQIVQNMKSEIEHNVQDSDQVMESVLQTLIRRNPEMRKSNVSHTGVNQFNKSKESITGKLVTGNTGNISTEVNGEETESDIRTLFSGRGKQHGAHEASRKIEQSKGREAIMEILGYTVNSVNGHADDKAKNAISNTNEESNEERKKETINKKYNNLGKSSEKHSDLFKKGDIKKLEEIQRLLMNSNNNNKDLSTTLKKVGRQTKLREKRTLRKELGKIMGWLKYMKPVTDSPEEVFERIRLEAASRAKHTTTTTTTEHPGIVRALLQDMLHHRTTTHTAFTTITTTKDSEARWQEGYLRGKTIFPNKRPGISVVRKEVYEDQTNKNRSNFLEQSKYRENTKKHSNFKPRLEENVES